MSKHRHGRGRRRKATETWINTGPDHRWLRHWHEDQADQPTNVLPGYRIGYGSSRGITINGRTAA